MKDQPDPIVIILNTGYGSVDNGARHPWDVAHDLAAAAGIELVYGMHYCQDRLKVPADLWPTVEDLLIEQKMLYMFLGEDHWRNVQAGSDFDKYLRRIGHKPAASQEGQDGK